MTEAAQHALTDRVSAGGSLLVFHAGSASHPSVTITSVVGHPVTAGMKTFTHPDEHYFMDIDPGITQILQTNSSLGTSSAGWVKEAGSGRVCAIIPGHTRICTVWLRMPWTDVLEHRYTAIAQDSVISVWNLISDFCHLKVNRRVRDFRGGLLWSFSNPIGTLRI